MRTVLCLVVASSACATATVETGASARLSALYYAFDGLIDEAHLQTGQVAAWRRLTGPLAGGEQLSREAANLLLIRPGWYSVTLSRNGQTQEGRVASIVSVRRPPSARMNTAALRSADGDARDVDSSSS